MFATRDEVNALNARIDRLEKKMSDPPKRFRVFECIDGDECLIASRDTFAEAEADLRRTYAQTRDAIDLSIWGDTGGILALVDTHGRLCVTPAGKRFGFKLSGREAL